MTGVLINAGTIIAGSLAGLILRRGLSDRMRKTLMQALGLCVIMIGICGAVGTKDTLCVIVCMVIGTVTGTAINIEKQLDRLGKFAERKLAGNGEQSVAKGFVTASLIFCVGAMAIVGSLESGLKGDHSTIVSKAIIDGVTSMILAGTMGIGVILSAAAVFVYQGLIVMLAGVLAPVLTDTVINEMSATGGLLIVGIGLNMLFEDKHFAVGNMLPAIFLPMAYIPLTGLF
ncbi:MAG: DUF554 domain-containing protein [Clostridia bacterium]|nr:DUF554 domain-containing protein [Clostridia bacterium]